MLNSDWKKGIPAYEMIEENSHESHSESVSVRLVNSSSKEDAQSIKISDHSQERYRHLNHCKSSIIVQYNPQTKNGEQFYIPRHSISSDLIENDLP